MELVFVHLLTLIVCVHHLSCICPMLTLALRLAQPDGFFCIVRAIIHWNLTGSDSGNKDAGVMNRVGLADEHAIKSLIFIEAAVAAIQSSHIFISITSC